MALNPIPQHMVEELAEEVCGEVSEGPARRLIHDALEVGVRLGYLKIDRTKDPLYLACRATAKYIRGKDGGVRAVFYRDGRLRLCHPNSARVHRLQEAGELVGVYDPSITTDDLYEDAFQTREENDR